MGLEDVVKQKVEALRKEEEGKLAGEKAHIKRVAERASQKVIAEAESRLQDELEATTKEAKAEFVEKLTEEKKNAKEDSDRMINDDEKELKEKAKERIKQKREEAERALVKFFGKRKRNC